MLQESVDSVRRLQRAFNDGDVEALVAECDPKVEWEEQAIPGIDPIFRGHDGVRRWAELVMGQELGSLEARVEGVEEAGDAVIASVFVEGEGTSSGVRVQMHVYMVLTFRAGKIARRQVFETHAEAVEAAGPGIQ
jgi:ketosteroid isomerase-like protein